MFFRGPISINVSIPMSNIVCKLFENLTGQIICFAKISFISSSSLYIFPSKFLTTAVSKLCILIVSSSFLNASDALLNFSVWNGPAVFKMLTFLAPNSLAMSCACSTATSSPEMTICPNGVKISWYYKSFCYFVTYFLYLFFCHP